MQGMLLVILLTALTPSKQNPSMVYLVYKNAIASLQFPSLSFDYETSHYTASFKEMAQFSNEIDGSYRESEISFTNSIISFQLKIDITNRSNGMKHFKRIICELFIASMRFIKSSEGTYHLVDTALQVNTRLIETELSRPRVFRQLAVGYNTFQDRVTADFIKAMTSMVDNYPLSRENYNFESFIYKLKGKKWFNCYYWFNCTNWIINIKLNSITYDSSDSCSSIHCKYHDVSVKASYLLFIDNKDIEEFTTEVVYDRIYFGEKSFSMDTPFQGNRNIAHLIRYILEREYRYYVYETLI